MISRENIDIPETLRVSLPAGSILRVTAVRSWWFGEPKVRVELLKGKNPGWSVITPVTIVTSWGSCPYSEKGGEPHG